MMPFKDWNLEANEEAGMKDPNNLNPSNDPFRAFMINSLFVDIDDDEHFE